MIQRTHVERLLKESHSAPEIDKRSVVRGVPADVGVSVPKLNGLANVVVSGIDPLHGWRWALCSRTNCESER